MFPSGRSVTNGLKTFFKVKQQGGTDSERIHRSIQTIFEHIP